MRFSHKARSFGTGSATLALLAGCSGSGSGVTAPATGVALSQSVSRAIPAARRFTPYTVARSGLALQITGVAPKPFFNPAALVANTGNTIAISDALNSVVYLYNSNGTLLSTLTGFVSPEGMASDINGDLFVADTGNGRIQIYAAGFKGPPKSLADPGQQPVGVDSFSNGRWVAVANVQTDSFGPGSLSIYKDSKLKSNISSPNLLYPFFCAFDATGNLYVTGLDANQLASVGEIANATGGGTRYTELTIGNTYGSPGGIQVTTAGSIAIDDQSNHAIYTYHSPKNGSLGSPVETTPLDGSPDPVSFAFTYDTKDLYTADSSGSSGEFAYPVGGAPVASFTIGGAEPIGVAVIPTQWPKRPK